MNYRWATESDFAECRRLHRAYGTTYYLASLGFPPAVRRRVDALYGFVRVPDEWVDNPGDLTLADRISHLDNWRSELLAGLGDIRPRHPALRAFCDVAREAGLTPEEPLRFIEAMRQDLTVGRYATYDDLELYMRGSAAAVGLMMCELLGAPETESAKSAAMALGRAMQLTNFLRDVAEDAARGRIYLPREDLDAFGVNEWQVLSGVATPETRRLVEFEIARARRLYDEARAGIPLLPGFARRPVLLAAVLYSRILDRIEASGCEVYAGRARTTRTEKLAVAARVLLLGA